MKDLVNVLVALYLGAVIAALFYIVVIACLFFTR